MKVAAVIPARMGSSRFPGKPLAPILGRPMLEHVFHRTAMSKVLSETVIATCDQEIFDAAQAFGARAIMTSDQHQRASDRVAEAAEKLDAEIVVLVQGDEPMTMPEMIDQAVEPMLADPSIACVNLAKRLSAESDYNDPNTIKMVMDLKGDALYFSRNPIPSPYQLGFAGLRVYKQVCIIPFTRTALFDYRDLEPTPLEVAESVDMLRFLEHGRKVRLIETQFDTQAVDTPQDLARVEAMMASDSLARSYLD
ncbi:MAG: 3-deoxy-manno-octulosonate cytidylyltransferase [Desulfarculaceae bacterium]|nr:3-deoxy-manno-octulosonate cytidylyltransferase [Desulfarculaceae bacterium]